MGLRSSVNRNLAEIVELHEEILGELHQLVPDSEYTQMSLTDLASKPEAPFHRRWRSLGAVPEDGGDMTWLQQIPGMMADPQVGAEVSKLFSNKVSPVPPLATNVSRPRCIHDDANKLLQISRFFIYEEYAAKYEMMIKDVRSAYRIMPDWDDYQKGIEALAWSVDALGKHSDDAKRALTTGDLLVKPIQRLCKYPLLFAELLKYTPVCDCPNSHMEIENALERLREATAMINRATDDAGVKDVLAKTWLLQDRLVFPGQVRSDHTASSTAGIYLMEALTIFGQRLDASRNRVRSFGHISLCGVLHVCWQTQDGVMGQYMICLLYHDLLCLATASRADQIYTIHACIALQSIKVQEADNGRGICVPHGARSLV